MVWSCQGVPWQEEERGKQAEAPPIFLCKCFFFFLWAVFCFVVRFDSLTHILTFSISLTHFPLALAFKRTPLTGWLSFFLSFLFSSLLLLLLLLLLLFLC